MLLAEDRHWLLAVDKDFPSLIGLSAISSSRYPGKPGNPHMATPRTREVHGIILAGNCSPPTFESAAAVS